MASRHESEFSSSSSSLPKTRWWSKETVAIVTGANKGIGFAIVKRMAELGLTVILTARNNARGMEAVESLNKLGLHVYYHQLDVSDASSIKAFNSWFANNFSALDILVNNAAVSFNDIHENSVEHAEAVICTNFYGPKRLIEELWPTFRCSSTLTRILNISSRLGLLGTDSETETESETKTVGSSHLTDMSRPTIGGVQPVPHLEGFHYRATGPMTLSECDDIVRNGVRNVIARQKRHQRFPA
ncbi:putative transcription repressor MYB4-like [Capsicum annuum]|nr:putative transcription repressor MYB4-like [Capsicum annuum]